MYKVPPPFPKITREINIKGPLHFSELFHAPKIEEDFTVPYLQIRREEVSLDKFTRKRKIPPPPKPNKDKKT